MASESCFYFLPCDDDDLVLEDWMEVRDEEPTVELED
jgi:hypothetical protein